MTTNLSKGQAFQVRVGLGPLTLRGFAFFIALHCNFGSKEIKIKRPNSILLTQKYSWCVDWIPFQFIPYFFHKIPFLEKVCDWCWWLQESKYPARIKKGINWVEQTCHRRTSQKGMRRLWKLRKPTWVWTIFLSKRWNSQGDWASPLHNRRHIFL